MAHLHLQPAALAPPRGYSHVVSAVRGTTVYVAGQVAFDADGRVVGAGDLRAQTEQVFANLKAILEEAGSGLDRLVKTTVFLTTLADFAGMNDVYRQHVGAVPPARSTVPVGETFPDGALVEIEAMAVKPAKAAAPRRAAKSSRRTPAKRRR